MNRQMNKQTRLLILFTCILLMFLFSGIRVLPFHSDVSAGNETTEPSDIPVVTETDEIRLSNPVDGLLDESPNNLPNIDAKEYLLFDTLSDTMLIGNGYTTPVEPAALTQIMTVLIAMEELDLSDTIVITKEMYEPIPDEYVRIGFSEGEVVTVKDCIHACLLKSANDACLALAVQISGSESAFVRKMNHRAQELGCHDTHFTNCFGQISENHYSTCHDLVLILEEALKHNDFRTISTQASYTIEPTNKYNDVRILNNANRFVSTPTTAYEYYIGGKTGYSEESKYILIAGAEKEGRILVGVMYGASNVEQRYDNMIDLFEYCFSNYTTTMIDSSEFNPVVSSLTSRIENSLVGTNLIVSNVRVENLSYYSTYLSVSSGGYSHDIDLSTMQIDPSKPKQVFYIPIYRTFSNNEKYEIGYIEVTISDPNAKEIETTKLDIEGKWSVKSIIIVSSAAVGLLLVMTLSVVLFRKMVKKRKFNKNHRNPRIL